MIVPATLDQLNPASYDLILGDEILVQVWQPRGSYSRKNRKTQILLEEGSNYLVDYSDKQHEYIYQEPSLEPKWKKVSIKDHTKNKPYRLQPNQVVLAHTQETFNLPGDIGAQFLLKSSRARDCMNHMLAGWCDPGWNGSKLTLELINSGTYHDLPLYPGLKIGQMVFHQLSQPAAQDYSVKGSYNGHSSVSGNITQEKA